MLRDLLGWVLYSPRRLLAVAASAVALAVLVVLQLPGSARVETDRQEDTRTSHTAVSPQPSASPSTPTQLAGSRGKVRRAALRFLDAYVVPPGARPPTAIPSELKNRATPALWRGLRLANPAALPRGTATDLDVEEVGSNSATVTAQVDGGIALELSVVAWTKGWRVSDVRPGGPA